MENIKERLLYFAEKSLGMGRCAFETHCGLSYGTIAKIGKGVSTTTLEKIAERCPDLNLDWLITGKGEMIHGKHSLDKESLQKDAIIQNLLESVRELTLDIAQLRAERDVLTLESQTNDRARKD